MYARIRMRANRALFTSFKGIKPISLTFIGFISFMVFFFYLIFFLERGYVRGKPFSFINFFFYPSSSKFLTMKPNYYLTSKLQQYG